MDWRKPSRSNSRIGLFLFCLSFAIGGAFFFGRQQYQRKLDQFHSEVRSNGLTIYTINSATTYYQNRLGLRDGFEFDLAEEFSKATQIPIRFSVKNTIAQVLEAVSNDPNSIGAAGLTQTRKRKKQFLFGPSYLAVKLEMICHRYRNQSATNYLVVSTDTSYAELLPLLKVEWKPSDTLSTEDILKQVNQNRRFCTLADSNIFEINRRYFPNLISERTVDSKQNLSWFFHPRAHLLQAKVSKWFEDFAKEGRLSQVLFKHYGFIGEPDPFASRKFKQRLQSRLPPLMTLFKGAAKKYGFHWTTLAALSYQESHWDPKAMSATGVRGLMMLTRQTASSLGVNDRMDPKQSIFGGAKYLRKLKDQLSENIRGQNRTWIAMAAYNVGMSHVQDAQLLAKRRRLNPYKWKDLRSVLPLLSNSQVFPTLPNGYARGNEPVLYVQRIRDYQDRLRSFLTSTPKWGG